MYYSISNLIFLRWIKEWITNNNRLNLIFKIELIISFLCGIMLYFSNLALSQYIREILTTPCKSYLGMFNPKDILNSVIFVET